MSAQQHSNYVNGQWVPGATWSKNINPSDLSDVVGEYAQADQAQTESAIAAARAAAPGWGNFNVQARADMLDKIGSEILARKDELGRLLSREEGKTLPEGVGEVARAGNIFKFFAGEVLRRTGELVPSVRPGVDVEVTREPLGVVGIISPWNFPAAIPAWKVAPALAYGNCVVFKPADLVPGSAWAMADIIARAGLPAGAFNLGNGPRQRGGRGVGERSARGRHQLHRVGGYRPQDRAEGRLREWPSSSSRWAARIHSWFWTMPTSRPRWSLLSTVHFSRLASAARRLLA